MINRKQQVVINNTVSSQRNVRSGVPQGSVLGPSLFLFYVNDIIENIRSEIRLFADDVIMYSPLESASDVIKFQKMGREMDDDLQCWQMQYYVCWKI